MCECVCVQCMSNMEVEGQENVAVYNVHVQCHTPYNIARHTWFLCAVKCGE